MSRTRRPPRVVPAALFIVAAGTCLLLRWQVGWTWLSSYLVAIQLPTFLLYGYDKRAASRRRQRIPERTLHLYALAGGSPAAFAGQLFFRHKTQKKTFQRVFWLLVIVQLALLVWSLWP